MASFLHSALKASAIVLLGGILSSEVAQANNASSLQSIGTESSSDPFSSRGDNTSSMMQMIHRVMQGETNVDRIEQRNKQAGGQHFEREITLFVCSGVDRREVVALGFLLVDGEGVRDVDRRVDVGSRVGSHHAAEEGGRQACG